MESMKIAQASLGDASAPMCRDCAAEFLDAHVELVSVSAGGVRVASYWEAIR